jgi:hypothetical protein
MLKASSGERYQSTARQPYPDGGALQSGTGQFEPHR